MFSVCHSASFGGPSLHALVGGDCSLVGVFDNWEVFLVYVLVPCFVDDVCRCCHVFGQHIVLLVCW